MSPSENKIKNTNENGGYKYKFSIVMSVYKVEEFINEAIDSIIEQDIGFDCVQLILVDDGSPDRSGEICDEYAKKYPDNVKVIHKENGGLCSARNEGLKHIEGRYVNFCDPDDILSLNTLSSVYSFFIENEQHVDIVAIPLFYFGDRTGAHHLNNKFNGGTRVIDLEKEYRFAHLSAASSFFRHEIAAKQYYDPRLIIAEDAEQILRELIDNPLLGVVAECAYHYRRRGGSQVTAGAGKKGWYTDYLKYLCLKTFEYAKEKYGYVPRYVQNAIMGDLRWRYTQPSLPPMLSDEEIAEYKELLIRCTEYVEDDVIMAQSSVVVDTKLSILAKKHGRDFIKKSHNNVYYGFDHRVDWRFSNNTLQLCFADSEGDDVIFRFRQVVLGPSKDMVEGAYLLIGDERYYADSLLFRDNQLSIGEAVSCYVYYSIRVPRAALAKREEQIIRAFTVAYGIEINNLSLSSGYLFPVSTKYKNSFAEIDGIVYRMTRGAIYASEKTASEKRKLTSLFHRELWKSNKQGERKAVIARILTSVYKRLHRKPIWIITDRLNKAGDNGEALFRYLKDTHFGYADYYYAITDCPDKEALSSLGSVVRHGSWRYKLLFLASDYIISSHADDFVINPFFNYYEAYRDIIKKKRYVFLQHGITQNDISGWLNRYNKNIFGFITAAKPESESLLTYDYFYEKKNVWEEGFARFDRLYRNEKRYITLMPTWRRYLMDGYDAKTGVWQLGSGFKESRYYKFYNSLITDERLLAACREYGYTLCFMPHPNIIPHIDVFDRPDEVKFFGLDTNYRTVYAESDMILTDYSSAAFDFAYLRKPLAYMHFDYEEFFSGDHVATPGYFNYKENGFGEVTGTVEETVDLIISYMKDGCKLRDVYRERIDSFFVYSDQNNCRRILERIVSSDKE